MKKPGWTWVAIDADTKLACCWHVGPRNGHAAGDFIDDLADRPANRVQLTSDGYRPYLEAVERASGKDIDYARLVKIYGESPHLKNAIVLQRLWPRLAVVQQVTQTRRIYLPAM